MTSSRLFLLILWAGTALSAQERVILFEPGNSGMLVSIREIELTANGRAWSVGRTLPVPAHVAEEPVAVADGRTVAWLGRDYVNRSTVLVSYDAMTGSASLVPVRHFDENSFLIADRVVPRVFVVEPTRVTFIDFRLQGAVIELPSVKQFSSGNAAGRYLVLQRRSRNSLSDAEAVVIDTDAAAVTRVIALGEPSSLRISEDGQRLYRLYDPVRIFGGRLDLISVATGQVIASAIGPTPASLFELDERRGAVTYNGIVYDAATLALIGTFPLPVIDGRRDFVLKQATGGATILLFSRGGGPDTGGCPREDPRIDVFDGRTYQLVNRIKLQGCEWMVAVR